MPRAIDLCGSVFGKLTVIHLHHPCTKARRSRLWLCRCTCGKHTVVETGSLRRGATRSCGSAGCMCRPIEDLTNRVFNFVRVIGMHSRVRYGARLFNIRWLCECLRCGKKFVTRSDALKCGATKSCGCYSRKKPTCSHDERIARKLWYNKYSTYKWRQAVFQKSMGRCFVCCARKAQIAHHINAWKQFPEQRNDVNNAVPLCTECHNAYHSWQFSKKFLHSTRRRWNMWLKTTKKV